MFVFSFLVSVALAKVHDDISQRRRRGSQRRSRRRATAAAIAATITRSQGPMPSPAALAPPRRIVNARTTRAAAATRTPTAALLRAKQPLRPPRQSPLDHLPVLLLEPPNVPARIEQPFDVRRGREGTAADGRDHGRRGDGAVAVGSVGEVDGAWEDLDGAVGWAGGGRSGRGGRGGGGFQGREGIVKYHGRRRTAVEAVPAVHEAATMAGVESTNHVGGGVHTVPARRVTDAFAVAVGAVLVTVTSNGSSSGGCGGRGGAARVPRTVLEMGFQDARRRRPFVLGGGLHLFLLGRIDRIKVDIGSLVWRRCTDRIIRIIW